MRVIDASAEILDMLDGEEILRKLELCGRVCYKSEDAITPTSAREFIRNVLKRGHESVIEHVSVTVRFIVDRGVSHELVRHRIASFSQESTRYCNYRNAGEITVIRPLFDWSVEEYDDWLRCMVVAEERYLSLISRGASPQEARSVLPNSLKTEVIMTANLREWRHFFKLRTSTAAHPQMREVACPLLQQFKKQIPVVFDDIVVEG